MHGRTTRRSSRRGLVGLLGLALLGATGCQPQDLSMAAQVLQQVLPILIQITQGQGVNPATAAGQTPVLQPFPPTTPPVSPSATTGAAGVNGNTTLPGADALGQSGSTDPTIARLEEEIRGLEADLNRPAGDPRRTNAAEQLPGKRRQLEEARAAAGVTT